MNGYRGIAENIDSASGPLLLNGKRMQPRQVGNFMIEGKSHSLRTLTRNGPTLQLSLS
jgi:hypothetical protein